MLPKFWVWNYWPLRGSWSYRSETYNLSFTGLHRHIHSLYSKNMLDVLNSLSMLNIIEWVINSFICYTLQSLVQKSLQIFPIVVKAPTLLHEYNEVYKINTVYFTSHGENKWAKVDVTSINTCWFHLFMYNKAADWTEIKIDMRDWVNQKYWQSF